MQERIYNVILCLIVMAVSFLFAWLDRKHISQVPDLMKPLLLLNGFCVGAIVGQIIQIFFA